MQLTNNPLSRGSGIVVQNLQGEVLIYDLKINKAFCLNETAAMVWELCDGRNSLFEIGDQMSRKLKTRVSEDMVWLTLNELDKNGLLDNGEEFSDHFAGLSRREVVRKIGLVTMVALPVILSLTAPNAATAQTPACLALLDRCRANTQCCSGNCLDPSGSINFCCIPGGFLFGEVCTNSQTCASGCCSGMGSFDPTFPCGPGFGKCVCGPVPA